MEGERDRKAERERDLGEERQTEREEMERKRQREKLETDIERGTTRQTEADAGGRQWALGATGRGPGMALRIPVNAPLLLMGLLTTGEWDPGLMTQRQVAFISHPRSPDRPSALSS